MTIAPFRRFSKRIRHHLFGVSFLLFLPTLTEAASESDSLAEVDQFVNDSFVGLKPTKEVLWLTSDIKEDAKRILKHAYSGLRVRYWGASHRTLWVLDEIGKDMPITIGVLIVNGQIQSVKILNFRESRGWEVRYQFFTDQYIGASIDENLKLNQTIDGITGATLSVRAVNKVARLALYLHSLTSYSRDTNES